MMRYVNRALASGVLLLLTACGGGGDDAPAPSPIPGVIDMGTLAVDAAPTSLITVTDPNSHAFTFPSSGAVRHTVTVVPGDGAQDPDLCVYQGDWHGGVGGLTLVNCSIELAGVTDSVVFMAAASTTYTIEVFNGSGTSASASYTVQVTEP